MEDEDKDNKDPIERNMLKHRRKINYWTPIKRRSISRKRKKNVREGLSKTEGNNSPACSLTGSTESNKKPNEKLEFIKHLSRSMVLSRTRQQQPPLDQIENGSTGNYWGPRKSGRMSRECERDVKEESERTRENSASINSEIPYSNTDTNQSPKFLEKHPLSFILSRGRRKQLFFQQTKSDRARSYWASKNSRGISRKHEEDAIEETPKTEEIASSKTCESLEGNRESNENSELPDKRPRSLVLSRERRQKLPLEQNKTGNAVNYWSPRKSRSRSRKRQQDTKKEESKIEENTTPNPSECPESNKEPIQKSEQPGKLLRSITLSRGRRQKLTLKEIRTGNTMKYCSPRKNRNISKEQNMVVSEESSDIEKNAAYNNIEDPERNRKLNQNSELPEKYPRSRVLFRGRRQQLPPEEIRTRSVVNFWARKNSWSKSMKLENDVAEELPKTEENAASYPSEAPESNKKLTQSPGNHEKLPRSMVLSRGRRQQPPLERIRTGITYCYQSTVFVWCPGVKLALDFIATLCSSIGEVEVIRDSFTKQSSPGFETWQGMFVEYKNQRDAEKAEKLLPVRSRYIAAITLSKLIDYFVEAETAQKDHGGVTRLLITCVKVLTWSEVLIVKNLLRSCGRVALSEFYQTMKDNKVIGEVFYESVTHAYVAFFVLQRKFNQFFTISAEVIVSSKETKILREVKQKLMMFLMFCYH